mgnify:FL=1
MNKIKNLREATGKTQKEIASYFNINISTVAKWETGESLPRADKLPELAKILGCTVDELLRDEAS